jgi:molybdopterin synthase catalytic subunit
MDRLTDRPIDVEAVLRAASCADAGAVVLFLGSVRRTTGDHLTESLDYECYPEMAERVLAELEAEASRRWSLLGCAIVHRVGHVEVGQATVAVAAGAAHRHAAFEAGQWLIDRIKQIAPIWKKENWADGTSQWIHPRPDAAKPAEEA